MSRLKLEARIALQRAIASIPFHYFLTESVVEEVPGVSRSGCTRARRTHLAAFLSREFNALVDVLASLQSPFVEHPQQDWNNRQPAI